MAICGLVVTLSSEQESREGALSVLSNRADLELGELQGVRLPVVVEAEDRRAHQALWDSLLAVDGVMHVDLAYVGHVDAEGVEHTREQSDKDLAKWRPGE